MAEVGIIITAKDKATDVIKKIGAVGNTSLGNLSGTGKKVGDTLRSMPEQLGKASTAMLLLQNSASQMGGKFADAANKATALLSLVAVGGPVGAGIAALTAVVAIGSSVWESYSAAERAAESASRSIQPVLEGAKERTKELSDRLKEAREELRFFGKTQEEIRAIKLAEQMAQTKNGIELLNKEIEILTNSNKKLEQQTEKVSYAVGGGGGVVHSYTKLKDSAKESIDLNNIQLKAFKSMVEELKRRKDILKESAPVEQAIAAKTVSASQSAVAAAKRETEAKRKLNEEKQAYLNLLRERESLLGTIAQDAARSESQRLSTLADFYEKDARAYDEAIQKKKQANIDFNTNMISTWASAGVSAAGSLGNAFSNLTFGMQEIEAEYRKQIALEDDLEKKRELRNEMQAARNEAQKKAIKDLMKTTINAAINAAEQSTRATIQAATKSITAKAADAAAGAASSQSAIPIFGPALAVAASAAIFALVRGFLTKFAAGGEVTGGIRGRDSVPAILTPGERVLTVEENNNLKSGGSIGGGKVVINLTAAVQNPDEMTDDQVKRWLLRISRHVEELHRDGQFLRTATVRR